MKTTIYNPSHLETEFARAVLDLKEQIGARIRSGSITDIEDSILRDNPSLVFKITDADGDPHEVVVTFIQRIEE